MQSESYLTRYKISKMDCSSEEQMVRMKLDSVEEIQSLTFDLANRQLTVVHEGSAEIITKLIDELDLDSELIDSRISGEEYESEFDKTKQVKLLWAVLIINFAFFVIEMATGLISNSMGLVADSLDMFADAAVYGLSLLAVGKSLSKKKLVAKLAGYFQFTLAVIGFIEVVRRFIGF